MDNTNPLAPTFPASTASSAIDNSGVPIAYSNGDKGWVLKTRFSGRK